MATQVLTEAMVLFEGRELTGIQNAVAVDFGSETGDDTSFADTTRSNAGTLKTAGFSGEGFWDDGTPVDADIFSVVGDSDKLITAANGNSVGDRSFSLVSVVDSFQPIGGSVGDIIGWNLNAAARNTLERGQVLFYSTSETSSGTSTPLNVSAGAANGLVAILHVFSASGSGPPTLDVVVESDTANDFTGAETTRATFSTASARTAERIVGTATGDTWFRANFTIAGTSPDFGFAVILIPTA